MGKLKLRKNLPKDERHDMREWLQSFGYSINWTHRQHMLAVHGGVPHRMGDYGILLEDRVMATHDEALAWAKSRHNPTRQRVVSDDDSQSSQL